ncbi:MAG: hypothetical protein EPN17_00440 [Methylobacter sp.]|nr:MAG: hypothetical protein EPN17_00440 [Methylobacter sp.]
MITRILTLLSFAAICLAPSITYATEPLFRDCSSALATKNFQRLQAYYTKSKENTTPSYCFKLNRDEFLVTVEDTGQIGQGLYYYDASNDSYGLVDGKYCPNIAIKQEFIGAHQKRYALIECSNLQHGNWDYGYLVLYLAPGKKRQSFIFKELLFVNEDPESGFCGSRIHDTATSIKGFHISGEGGNNVRVEVNVEEENCKTSIHKKYARFFQPRDGDFVEVNTGPQ